MMFEMSMCQILKLNLSVTEFKVSMYQSDRFEIFKATDFKVSNKQMLKWQMSNFIMPAIKATLFNGQMSDFWMSKGSSFWLCSEL